MFGWTEKQTTELLDGSSCSYSPTNNSPLSLSPLSVPLPSSLSLTVPAPSLPPRVSLSLHYLLSPLLLRLPFFSTAVGQAAAAQAGRWCTGGPADRDARVDRGGAVAQGRIRCGRPASIRPLRRAAAGRWRGWARVRASEPVPPRAARRRGAGMADPPPLRCLPSSSLLGAASAAAESPPPPLPTLLLLSAQRGRPWEERSSTRPRASGAARADRAARAAGSSPLDTYPFVSF